MNRPFAEDLREQDESSFGSTGSPIRYIDCWQVPPNPERKITAMARLEDTTQRKRQTVADAPNSVIVGKGFLAEREGFDLTLLRLAV